MRKLTKRERILLGTAFVLYTGFFCWRCLILPVENKMREVQERRSQLEQLMTDNGTAEEGQTDEKTVLLEKEPEPEKADLMIQTLAARSGMSVRSFQAAEPQEDMEEEGLIKSPIQAELWGPDFACAQLLLEEMGKSDLPIVLEQVRAEKAEDGVELYLEMELYGRREESEE